MAPAAAAVALNSCWRITQHSNLNCVYFFVIQLSFLFCSFPSSLVLTSLSQVFFFFNCCARQCDLQQCFTTLSCRLADRAVKLAGCTLRTVIFQSHVFLLFPSAIVSCREVIKIFEGWLLAGSFLCTYKHPYWPGRVSCKRERKREKKGILSLILLLLVYLLSMSPYSGCMCSYGVIPFKLFTFKLVDIGMWSRSVECGSLNKWMK